MVREIAITAYLFVFHILFRAFSLFPQKKKTAFVASFGNNISFTLNELERQTDDQIVILKTSQCKKNFGSDKFILDFELVHPIAWIRSIYHIATSQKIFADNYFGFLAVTNFKSNVQCIQLWHAAGAIKKFALKDPSIKNRSPRAFTRFKTVYHRFNHVVVGSERMAAIYKQSFDITNDKTLKTGIPRTDFFYDSWAKMNARKTLLQKLPIIADKKVILYTPTYRDNELNKPKLELDIDKMYQEFKGEYVLLLRLHPAVNGEYQNKYPGFVINVSSNHNISHLLVVTDILISDYSSIPFEFSLLEKPMIFFAYDLEKFANDRGFWENYQELVPGPVVYNNEDLVHVIRNEEFDMTTIRQFAETWNLYSQGQSSKNLINRLYSDSKNNEKAEKVTIHS